MEHSVKLMSGYEKETSQVDDSFEEKRCKG